MGAPVLPLEALLEIVVELLLAREESLDLAPALRLFFTALPDVEVSFLVFDTGDTSTVWFDALEEEEAGELVMKLNL